MLLKLWIFLLALVPGMAAAFDARPAELPPDDFASRQYIDSRGCVFLRDDAGAWLPRVARDGAPICGYPPTFSARGIDGRPRLRALDPDAGRSRAELLEQALSETVLTNLRPGELAGDANPMEKLPDMGPEPANPAPSLALKAALAAAPAVRHSMGEALQPNRRLCQLLGYDDISGAQGRARDPSQGYCSSLRESDLSRLTFVRSVAEVRKENAPPAESAETGKAASKAAPPAAKDSKAAPKTADKPGDKAPAPAPAKTAAKKPGSDKAEADKAGAEKTAAGKAGAGNLKLKKIVPVPPKSAPAKEAAKQAAKPAPPGIIPAGARYVQFGTYADADNADRAAQVVAQMGYPVMRGKDRVKGKDVQFVLAGPFGDRETIVRALDAIRRAGFKDAYPR